MDTKEEILARMKRKKEIVVPVVINNKQKNSKNSLVTKFLFSIIFVFSSLIFVKTSDNNESLFKKYVLTNSMNFTSFNKWYDKYLGSVAPSIKNDEFVFNDKLTFSNIEKLDNKEILKLNSSIVSSICGGIIVYSGEKEDFGNTIIVQGNDGKNIWYGNLENVSLTLYDYIEENEIIGEAKDSNLYLLIKDGDKTLSYEEYEN